MRDLEAISLHSRTRWNDQIPELKRFDDFTTTDWLDDNLQQHIRKNKGVVTGQPSIRRLYEQLQTYIILTAVGVCIGLVAGFVNIVTQYLASLKTGHCTEGFYLSRGFCCWGELEEEKCTAWVEYTGISPVNYVIFILMSIAFAATACKLVMHYAPAAAGSGISEIKVIVSGFSLEGFLDFSVFLMKSVGLPLAIASGLALGKEGPSVHFAVCIGSVICKLFATKFHTAEQKTMWFRNVLIASSAAGVAVAFGSPMGGVLFSVEDITSQFKLSTMWESYYCALVATSTLQFVNPFRTGQVVLFQVVYDEPWHFFEIPFYIILGIFGGVYGIFVAKMNIKAVSFRKKFLSNIYMKEVIVLAFISAAVGYFNDFLKMDMTEAMQILFQECGNQKEEHRICDISTSSKVAQSITSLLIATAIRMVFIIFTYGCKVPAGIFVPSMACGATFGRALGIFAQWLISKHPDNAFLNSQCSTDDVGSCITPGIYAFLGAAACLSGITHMFVTVVVIMFELTGALKHIIPTMIAVAVTKLINDTWGKGGIAEQMITFNGLPFIDASEEFDFHRHPISDAMTTGIVALLSEGMPLEKLQVLLSDTTFNSFPIVESAHRPFIKGYISREDIKTGISNYQGELRPMLECVFNSESLYQEEGRLNLTSLVNPAPITVDINTPCENVMEFFHKLGPRCILVESNGELKGLITRKDILKYEYFLHHQDFDRDALQREQTFAREQDAWRTIQSLNDLVSDGLKRMVPSRMPSYQQLSEDLMGRSSHN